MLIDLSVGFVCWFCLLITFVYCLKNTHDLKLPEAWAKENPGHRPGVVVFWSVEKSVWKSLEPHIQCVWIERILIGIMLFMTQIAIEASVRFGVIDHSVIAPPLFTAFI